MTEFDEHTLHELAAQYVLLFRAGRFPETQVVMKDLVGGFGLDLTLEAIGQAEEIAKILGV